MPAAFCDCEDHVGILNAGTTAENFGIKLPLF
jgi:hypothetical protein